VADVRALAQMTAALRRLRPDLINAGTPKAGLLGMLAARARRIPARVHTLHGLRYEAAHGPARTALWSAQRASCAAATHVICVGDGLRARAVATHLLRPGEGIVIGGGTVNGIDLDRFRLTAERRAEAQHIRAACGIAPGTPVFGYLGRLARDKGLGDLRRAWELAQLAGAHLLLGGSADETDPADPADLAAFARMPDVTRLGHIDHAPSFLAALDVLVLPTWREGFPTTPLEAAALGLPVVATTATGCADAVIDGETGTLVPTHDPPVLAAALRRYAADPALRAAHGAAGATRVAARFSRARVHALTIACYRRILDDVTR
jgi:glycosyltransferase involved in cell wall biosynthesis